MIHWSLTLTGNQVAILKALEPREYGKPHSYTGTDISHWISGIRVLLKEGLIEHREEKLPSGYIDPHRSGQFLTGRGRFILHMIEEDLARFLGETQTQKLPPRKAKGKAA